ncbi:MAG: LptF/LptG family permease [Victivallales bacterium]|nr:LptF/LptG family permease [Victivallales bacterium]
MALAKRQISKILFRHVSREFLIPFACSVLAFAFLFMVNNIFDDLKDFTSHSAPFQAFFKYVLALQPHNLLNVVPVSVLLATSFMTVMLGRNNELCAMRTAGLSLAVCAIPVWIYSLVACVLVALISESWGERCLDYARSIQEEYGIHSHSRLAPIALNNTIQHRDWALLPTQQANSFTNVILRQFDADGNTLYVLAAKAAKGDAKGHWTFENAVKQTIDKKGVATAVESHDVMELDFEETPGDLHEVTSPMEKITFGQAYRLLHRATPPSPKVAHRLRTVLWYNLTFPLASLVAALFGFSMTIANQRSEIMRGFAGAVGMLVLFYIVGQVIFVIGKNGWLPPFIAGAVPSLAFTVGGIFNVWRKQ